MITIKELRCKKCNKLLVKIEVPKVTTDEEINLQYTSNKASIKRSRSNKFN